MRILQHKILAKNASPLKRISLNYRQDETVMNYKDSKLESQNIDFEMLVREYHDGILLFAISDEEVWGKAIRDTVGLEKFYQANKQNYQWKERVDATLYKCGSDSIARLVILWLENNVW